MKHRRRRRSNSSSLPKPVVFVGRTVTIFHPEMDATFGMDYIFDNRAPYITMRHRSQCHGSLNPDFSSLCQKATSSKQIGINHRSWQQKQNETPKRPCPCPPLESMVTDVQIYERINMYKQTTCFCSNSSPDR